MLLPVAPKFWALSPSGEVAGYRQAASERAQVVVPTVQAGLEPWALIDEKLAQRL